MNRFVLHRLRAWGELADRYVKLAVNCATLWRPRIPDGRPSREQQPHACRKAEHREQSRIRQTFAKGLPRKSWIIDNTGNDTHQPIPQKRGHLLAKPLLRL